MVDVVIVCALQEEVAAVVSHLTDAVHEMIESLSCYYATVERTTRTGPTHHRVAVLQAAGMGNLESLHTATLAITQLSPHFVFLVGICGGIGGAARDYMLGDVVVSNSVYYYEPAKICSGGIEPRGRLLTLGGNASAELLKSAEALRNGNWTTPDRIRVPWPAAAGHRHRPCLKTGMVCSGEKVVANARETKRLSHLCPEAVSIEMEAAGIYYACAANQVPFLIVKSVSDFADKGKGDSHRLYAAATAASFVYSLLVEGHLLPPRRWPPRLLLSDLFGLFKGEAVRVVLPSYVNQRHSQARMSNYPYNIYETAFDDVYCAMRIFPRLEDACGRGNVRLEFAEQPRSSCEIRNLVCIGSSVSNSRTRGILASQNAKYQFGDGVHDHDIVGDAPDGETIQSVKVRHAGAGSTMEWITDYGLLSVFRRKHQCSVVVAGCRAYGQLLLGDFLADDPAAEDLSRLVLGGDYQCVVRASVVGRDYSFDGIHSLWTRALPEGPWERRKSDSIDRAAAVQKSQRL
ncbi:MAG: hypothetical protein HY297_05560 [Thaumarchaeota archaeon]|nr:hypothetical protein [Nitrososphaerota archaeon]